MYTTTNNNRSSAKGDPFVRCRKEEIGMGEAIIRHIEDHAAAASQARALWLQFEVNIEAQLVIPPGVEWFIFNV